PAAPRGCPCGGRCYRGRRVCTTEQEIDLEIPVIARSADEAIAIGHRTHARGRLPLRAGRRVRAGQAGGRLRRRIAAHGDRVRAHRGAVAPYPGRRRLSRLLRAIALRATRTPTISGVSGGIPIAVVGNAAEPPD